MSDIAYVGDLSRYESTAAQFRPSRVENIANPLPVESAMAKPPTAAASTSHAPAILLAVIVALLGVITTGGGFYLSGLKTDFGEVRQNIGEVRKDVSDIRVEAAKTNTKLDDLNGEIRRRFPR